MVILGIDYGRRRIGLAVSDPLEIAAHGLPTLEVRDVEGALEAIARLVSERGVERVVVGLPLNMDGSSGPQAHRVRGFVKLLKRRLPGVPVETVDERLSSAEAHRALSRRTALSRRRASR